MDHKNDGLAIFAIIISIIGCICAMFPLLNIVSIVVIFIGFVISVVVLANGKSRALSIIAISIYVLNLDPGEVKTYEAFKFDEISDEEFNMIKDAKFKVINAKEYLNDGIINKEDLKDNNLVK